MDGLYLVPANAKKSLLVMGFMRWIDVFILAVGVASTVILLLVFEDNNNTLITIGICLPTIIAGLLVLPIPNYHNTLVALQSIISYYRERRNYVWRGWCIYDEFKDDK